MHSELLPRRSRQPLVLFGSEGYCPKIGQSVPALAPEEHALACKSKEKRTMRFGYSFALHYNEQRYSIPSDVTVESA
jgi:hypothetical protein